MIRSYIATEVPRAILRQELETFSRQVHDILVTLYDEAIKYNTQIELFEAKNGRKLVTVFCDNIELRLEIQEMLDKGFKA